MTDLPSNQQGYIGQLQKLLLECDARLAALGDMPSSPTRHGIQIALIGRIPDETPCEPMEPATLTLVLDWILNEEGWKPEHPPGFWNSKFDKMAKAVQAEWNAIQSSQKTPAPQDNCKHGIPRRFCTAAHEETP